MFFVEVIVKSGVDGVVCVLFVIFMGVIFIVLNVFIFGLLCVWWMVKLVFVLFFVVFVIVVYYLDNYSVYFDVSMVWNVLKIDGVEVGELLIWGFFFVVLIKGVVLVIVVCMVRF